MKTYLVGGAVRDELLNRDPKDRDYVVVGATEQQMMDLGYDKVGADFPVFLKDGCEYALARTERKTGSGYNGFTTDFNPCVTLEDDLRRRDLTINAMAKDLDTGEVIDPFGGYNDLMNGVLRHVSPAFAEDPLRVLRVARFQARYGFNIADETMDLMKSLVVSGEMEHLTTERVWLELEKAFSEPRPDLFVLTLILCKAWPALFPYVSLPRRASFAVNQAKLMTFAQKVMLLFSFSDKASALATLDRYKAPTDIVRGVSIFLDMQDAKTMWMSKHEALDLLKSFDVFRRPDDFIQATQVSYYSDFHEFAQRLEMAYEQMKSVNFTSLTAEQRATLKGADVGKAIDQLRIKAIGV